MSARLPTVESFLADVKDHRLFVERDEGVYRHLRCAKPGTRCDSFDIVTYPGHLVFSGDRGCYVFSRMEDMLAFFQMEQPVDPNSRIPRDLRINPSYWGEKCVSRDGRRGLRKYNYDTFVAEVKRVLEEWITEEGDGIPQRELDDLRQAVKDHVVNAEYAVDSDFAAIRAAIDFDYTFECNHRHFDGFTEMYERVTIDEWDYHFIWCCYALAWAVQEYDKAKAKVTP